MKSTITFLLALVSMATFAQKEFQGKAVYMEKTSIDMNRFGNEMTEQQKQQMVARLKNVLEKTYTLNFTKSES